MFLFITQTFLNPEIIGTIISSLVPNLLQ